MALSLGGDEGVHSAVFVEEVCLPKVPVPKNMMCMVWKLVSKETSSVVLSCYNMVVVFCYRRYVYGGCMWSKMAGWTGWLFGTHGRDSKTQQGTSEAKHIDLI